MTVYRRKASQPLKWLIALIVFLMAMGITFTDVSGSDLGGPSTGIQANDRTDTPTRPVAPDDPNQPTNGDDPNAPTAIPEPTTLILLAGGLGAMYATRRWRNRSK